MNAEKSNPVIDWLIDHDTLSPEGVERAVAANADHPIEMTLMRLGLVSEKDMAEAICSVTLWDPLACELPEEPILRDRLSDTYLKHHYIIPIRIDDDTLMLATPWPQPQDVLDHIEFASGLGTDQEIALLSDIERAREQLYGGPSQEEGIVVNGEDADRLSDMASDSIVIRFVDRLITEAVSRHASDIHIEPLKRSTQVRFRIDGILSYETEPPHHHTAAIVSRIKILGDLNIAERRLPQDGRIRFPVEGRDIDIRISTIPTMHGESVVMRLLDQSQLALDFKVLGFSDEAEKQFKQLLDHPHGILLVSGPTGSGKTTSLYAALNYLNSPRRKILTCEDPIEYQLDGINQVAINVDIGVTFATTLRAFLRQDPDILMVGEIRDSETAAIAVQAALTGHLVLSTVHTNDAAGTIARLKDLDVPPFLLSDTMIGAMAQRLVRKLCQHCKKSYVPSNAVRHKFDLADQLLFEAVGCEHCHYSGYSGRLALIEILTITPEMIDGGQLIQSTLIEDGLSKAALGITTLDEVLRVTRRSS